MRHYDRSQYRHLDDAQRYRDYDYIADDPWTGPNERAFGPAEHALHGARDARTSPGRRSEREPTMRSDLRSVHPRDAARPEPRRGGSPSFTVVSRIVALLGRSGNAVARRMRSILTRGKVSPGRRGSVDTDEAVRTEIEAKLASSHAFDPRAVKVSVENGDVILEGHVPDRRARRIIEDLIEEVPGIADVMNRLHVGRSSP